MTAIPITYQGRIFPHKVALAAHLGVPLGRLVHRIKHGWPEEEWGKGSSIKESPITYRGVSFRNINMLAEFLGVKSITLRQKIKSGKPQSEWAAVKPRARSISYQGKTFDSISLLAKYLGINSHTLCDRIRAGLPEEAWATGVVSRSTGYCLADMPEEIQQMAISLAASLGIEPSEAYAQMLEELV